MRILLLFLLASAISFAQTSPPPDRTDTVSVFELQHKLPPKAIKEGRAADKAFAKHNIPAYIDHVQKAIAIDPDYVIARRNLGVVYLMVDKYEDAVQQFQEVLKRDPRSVPSYAGLSCAYLQLEHYGDAETAARRALDIDSTSEPGRYYLGLSLAFQNKGSAEALRNLQQVAERYPKAHVALAEILSRLGMKAAAKGELEEYLSSSDPDVRSQVQNWLSTLR